MPSANNCGVWRRRRRFYSSPIRRRWQPAARRFRITRKGDKTCVELLDDEARIEEVARMLGAVVTEEARRRPPPDRRSADATAQKARKRA
jgi:hypothetical protein